MGKKLDALLGRSFRASKFKALLNLAITRLSILKNHRHVRYSQAKSDVSQLLQLGHHQSALLRVEHVIKELNMLDVFLLLHGYFNLLLDRVHVIQQHHRDCPDELREAISTLLFAASRIGEFPELQQIRALLTSRYGRELAAHSIELRSNCAVNLKMVQKLSTRQPPLELRMKVLQEIAVENNIVLKLDEASTPAEQISADSSKPTGEAGLTVEETEDVYGLSDSIKPNKKYKDVADAAQAAFESAAYAAAAARAAVVLSQSDSRAPDDHDNPSNTHGKSSSVKENKTESEHRLEGKDISQAEGSSQGDGQSESRRLMSDSSTDFEDIITEVQEMSLSFTEDPVKLLEKDMAIYDEEEDTQCTAKATKVEDENLMAGENREDIGHGGQHMVRSAKAPSIHRAGTTGPVSVRTRRVRGY